jgi:hypothetical protein
MADIRISHRCCWSLGHIGCYAVLTGKQLLDFRKILVPPKRRQLFKNRYSATSYDTIILHTEFPKRK